MTVRPASTPNAPCWADLWTSDVASSRSFYGDLFGWEALAPDEQFGGYFNFVRDGQWIAGGMGPMGDVPADDTWKYYLRTDDIAAALARAESAGATVRVGAMAVADLGAQAVLTDPTGAVFGLWQPGTFAGFGVIEEPGAPSWFELHTTDFAAATTFYRGVLGYEVVMVSDTDGFRYATFRNPGSDEDFGGIADSGRWLGDRGSHWAIYWHVADTAATLGRVAELGGSVVNGPDATPYGHLATATDPAGAEFKLRSLP